MKYPFLERLNPAQVIARATYRKINDVVIDTFRSLGGFENLPESFDVSGEGWTDAERAIDEAAKAEDIERAIELCQAYERRALAYFDAWMEKLSKQERAA